MLYTIYKMIITSIISCIVLEMYLIGLTIIAILNLYKIKVSIKKYTLYNVILLIISAFIFIIIVGINSYFIISIYQNITN